MHECICADVYACIILNSYVRAYTCMYACLPLLFISSVSVNAQTDAFTSEKYVQNVQIVGVIAVSHEYTSKILGQDVTIRPPFGL